MDAAHYCGCNPARLNVDIDSEAGPLCYPLLTDFVAVLTDPSRRPTHLCGPTRLASTALWSSQYHLFHRDLGEAADAWCSTWPLPIGRAALREHARRWGSHFQHAMPHMVFDGAERAGVAFRGVVAGQEIDVFGLVTRNEEHVSDTYPGPIMGDASSLVEGTVGYDTWDDLVFDVRGADPFATGIQDFGAIVRRWWAPFRGQEITPGKPTGSGVMPETEFASLLQSAVNRLPPDNVARFNHSSLKSR